MKEQHGYCHWYGCAMNQITNEEQKDCDYCNGDCRYCDKYDKNQEQPELPILRNNDQRKGFIEAYETWPIWIDQELTGERYYRYDFDNGNSIVIKVYYCKVFDYKLVNLVYEERFRDDWGKEEYYLLKPDKYFKDCETNKSSLIDYLKELQKKGD